MSDKTYGELHAERAARVRRELFEEDVVRAYLLNQEMQLHSTDCTILGPTLYCPDHCPSVIMHARIFGENKS